MTDAEPLLDIKQAAQFLKVSEMSLRRWTNSGRLPCVRVGGKRERRFRRSDLLAFLEHEAIGREVGGAAPASTGHVRVGGIPVPFGSHLVAVYSSDVGRTQLAVGFVADGFNVDGRCYLIAAPGVQKQILKQLEKAVTSVRSERDSGRLVLLEYRDSVDSQLEMLETALLAGVRAGAQSLRLVGDCWGLAKKVSASEMIRYEAEAEQLLRRLPVATLCLYDARRFSGLALLNALKAHSDAFRYPTERLLA
jgi:transcriptional repressor of dcmA and dcmR